MSTVSFSAPQPSAPVSAGPVDKPRVQPGTVTDSSPQPDTVDLSAGSRLLIQTSRIALNAKAGNLTGDEASQLYAEVSATAKQLSSDKAANGGTLSASDTAALQQAESQTGQQIYGAAHNGAATPNAPVLNKPELRDLAQTARVALNEKAGNLTSSSADALYDQIKAAQQQMLADEAANGGSLSASDGAAIDALQSGVSEDIHSQAHPAAN